MVEFRAEIIVTFILYLGLMLAIGWLFYKRTKNLSDYILGGRKLNSWVASLSAEASDMSGWLLLGLPGYAYLYGMKAFWIALGLAVGTYLNWKLVAKRLRKYTQIAGNSLTLSDYFENRFRDNTKILKIASALFILIFFLFYTAAQFVAGGKLFNTVFGVQYELAVAIGAIVVISYTFLGGFMAVCWTDFFQGILMFFAILIVPIVGMNSLGGYNATIDKVQNINPNLMNMFTNGDGTKLSFIAIFSLFAWCFGYFGQPHILSRFMAIRSSKEVKQSRLIAMVWVILALVGAMFVGIVGRVYLSEPLVGADSEKVFMLMANLLFHPAIAGIILAAILAAIMSTADSQLLVTSSALTEDIYKAVFKKNASEKELVWVSRISVIIVAIVAFLLALDENSSVLQLVEYAWAGFGATFGPVIILSLYWPRMTKIGAMAGIVSGGAVVIIWKQLSGGIFDLYEIVPGFICSIIAIIIFSLLDKEPSKEILDEFNSVKTSDI